MLFYKVRLSSRYAPAVYWVCRSAMDGFTLYGREATLLTKKNADIEAARIRLSPMGGIYEVQVREAKRWVKK